jgi:hypothetical protein
LRDRIEADPIGALAAEGINIDSSVVPLGGVHLPGRQEILDHLPDLVDELYAFGPLLNNIVFLWLRP